MTRLDYFYYEELKNPKLLKDKIGFEFLETIEKNINLVQKIKHTIKIKGIVSNEDKYCADFVLCEIEKDLEFLFNKVQLLL